MIPTDLPELGVSAEARTALRTVASRFVDIDAVEFHALAVGLNADDIPGTSWRDLMTAIVETVGRRGYAILRGMDLDDGKTLLLLSTSLGKAFGTYGGDRIVKRFRMSPWTHSLSHTVKAGDFHTDGNVSADPPVATLMQCEVEDPGGDGFAEQRVADLKDLLVEVQTDDDLVSFLTRDEAIMAHEGSPRMWRGRLVDEGRIRYHPASLRVAAQRTGSYDAAKLEARLAKIHDAAMAVSLPFYSRPGDVLIVSNTHALHYRGECSVRFTHYPSDYCARSLLVMHRMEAA